MSPNIDNQIKDLAARYADCGINEDIIRKMMSGKESPAGLDARAKLIGIRMCLGMEFNRQEFFSLDDVAHVTGESKEQVMELCRIKGVTPISVSMAPWLANGP